MSNAKLIPLTKGQFAIVDAADYEYLSQWKWTADKKGKTFYAMRNKNKRMLHMHVELLGIKGVDHKDGNGLNNTRSNLRAATKSQNACNAPLQTNNTSGFKGVCWHIKGAAWRACITIMKKQKHIGIFKNKKLAAMAYDKAALVHFGEFEKTNKMLGLLP